MKIREISSRLKKKTSLVNLILFCLAKAFIS
jgi:hypothetical protein